MKKTLATLFGVALLCIGMSAQMNTLGTTTLSSAVTSGSQTIVYLASATGVSTAPPTVLYVDKEAMYVTAISGTAISVTRGFAQTGGGTHVSGANVFVGRPDWFQNGDPSGACTTASTYVTPYFNLNNGNQWLCSTITLTWVPSWGNPGNSASPVAATTAVASAAGLITPSGPLFHVTGTAAITGFNIPLGYNGGGFCIIPDGTFTTTAANNIALASTAVVSKRLCYSYDSAAAKPFFPSY